MTFVTSGPCGHPGPACKRKGLLLPGGQVFMGEEQWAGHDASGRREGASPRSLAETPEDPCGRADARFAETRPPNHRAENGRTVWS